MFWHSKILPFITGELRGCAWEPPCACTFSSSLTDIRFPQNLHKQNIKPKLVATSKNRAAIAIPAIWPGVQKCFLPATTAALAGDFTGELCTITGGGDCTGEAGGIDKGGASGVDTGVGESKGGAGGVDEGVGESKGGAVGVNEGVGETNGGGGNWVNGGGGTTDGGGGRDCGAGGRDGGGGGAGEVLNWLPPNLPVSKEFHHMISIMTAPQGGFGTNEIIWVMDITRWMLGARD